MNQESESKYFSFLSGLTVKELHDLAREGEIYDHWSLRKANLIRLLDDRYANERYWYQHEFKECLRRWVFPETLRAWVGLFVSDKSVAEHYVQLILRVLSPSNCFGRRKPVARLLRGRKEYISLINWTERREEVFSAYLRLGK